MRVHHLEIEGFGPFRERQHVDFDALADDGIFLITGRTGVGKTSILDAICFALYGGAPRYGNTEQRFRSDHAGPDDPTEVVLEFSVREERYRVRRSPEYERTKKHGSGTTRSPHRAELERWADGGWTGVAARPVDVGHALAPVLQLDQQQFLQVVLLAQNRFQEFLRAKSEERLKVLRAVFGTERFEFVEQALHERAAGLAAAVRERSAALDSLVQQLQEELGETAPTEGVVEWARDAAARAVAAAAAADAALREAGRAFSRADEGNAETERIAEFQRRRSAAEAALAALADDDAELAALGAERAAALQAASVAAEADAASAATTALAAVERVLAAASAEAGSAAESPDEAVREQARDAAESLGRLGEALVAEARIPDRHAAVSSAATTRDDARTALTALDEAAGALPTERQGLVEQRAAATAAAGRVAALAEAERAAVAAAAAAGAADDLARGLETDLARESAAAAAVHAASAALEDVLERRLAGSAAVLAGTLVAGAPCPVCGSTRHPSPASGADAVGDELLEGVRDALSAAEGELAIARDAARSTAVALSAARGAALGRSPAEAGELAAAARGARAAAERAAAETRRLGERIAELDARAERAAADRGAAAAQLDAAEQALALARGDLERESALVAAALEGAASVADRVRAIRDRRDALDALLDARHAESAARREADRAAERLATRLASAGFADAAEAAAAARTDEWLERSRIRLEAAERQRAVAAATLADPEVAAAGAEPVDVSAAREAKRAALEARDAAADEAVVAAGRADRTGDLAGRIHAADGGLAAERRDADRLRGLARTLRGEEPNERRMRLESYVLAAQLEQIIAAANARLTVMTEGRYALVHDDAVGYGNIRSGLGLKVLDEYTGRARPTSSLSGGETFLASLALALGLAAVVSEQAGGVRLDTLFVDEGFGSLDDDTRQIAMSTLDSLRTGGRLVGLISHVGTMQEEIRAGLHVEQLPDGSSRVVERAP